MATDEEYKMRRGIWIAALRSDSYEQGKRQLRDGDKYCCLGVGCEVYREVTGKGYWNGSGSFVPHRTAGPSWAALPDVVRDWYGLPRRDPVAGPIGNRASLSMYNDHKGYSFEQIADLIDTIPYPD